MNLEGIILKFKDQNHINYDPDMAFNSLFASSTILFLTIMPPNSKKKKLKADKDKLDLAYNNYLVNLVSALEIFYKHIILSTNWEEEGYNKLLKEKVTLAESFELFGREKVTRQYIITEYFSFQNFLSISHTFDSLTGKQFYNELEQVSQIFFANTKKGVSQNDQITLVLKTKYPQWRKTIMELYQVRNKFIHEGIIEGFSKAKFLKTLEVVSAYKAAVTGYILQNHKQVS